MEFNVTTDNCQTVYPSRKSFSGSMLAVLLTCNVILTLLNIIVNVFLIYALKVTNQLRNISCTLIAYLCMSDICVGLVLQNLVSVLLGAFKKNINCAADLSGQFLSYIFPQISGVMIMIIALDRWLHMKFLNKYSTLMNMRRANFLVLANIILAVVIAIASLLASIYKEFFLFNAILVATDVTVVVVIYIAYIFTFRSVRGHMRSMRKRAKENGPAQPSSGATKKKTSRRDARLAKTMVFILTSLTICYLPYFIVGLYWSYLRYYKNTVTSLALDTLLWFCFLLVYLNSSLNAIIFIRRNKHGYRLLKRQLGFRTALEVSSTDCSSGNQNTDHTKL